MGVKAHAKKGAVVLDDPAPLPKGAEVDVALKRKGRRRPTLGQELMKFPGKAKGLPRDLARNHDHYLYGTTNLAPSTSESRFPISSRHQIEGFRVGGKILVRMGKARRVAQIVEDRGPIGYQGRQILRVRFVSPKGEEQPTFEIPADDVAPAPNHRRQPRKATAEALQH
jgi:hypothetical protein